MSRRELKSLDGGNILRSDLKTRSGKTRQKSTMADTESLKKLVDELKAELTVARKELDSKSAELAELRSLAEVAQSQAEEARELAESRTTRVKTLERELETEHMRGELEKFRAL